MIIYCITLLIWVSINLFADKPVYAQQPQVPAQTTVRETAAATVTENIDSGIAETAAEPTTSGIYIAAAGFPESYVIGAVAAEMPVYFKEEALKAQAVACRTYACREFLNNKNTDLTAIGQAYLSDTELKRRWGADYEKNRAKIQKAVNDTCGEILLYDNEPILAAFCSASGGMTEDSGNVWGTSLPYLRPVNSSLDKQAPVYMQQQCIGIGRLSAALGVDDASDIYVEKRTQSGYVLCVRAGGKTFSGDDIRRCLSLRSNNFYVDINGDTANFVVYGYGHGIGMSQYGAEYMAGNGAGYREILAHYYTGVSFGRLCEIN